MNSDRQNQSSVLAHLRHELRTPINAIIGYSEMLLEDIEAEENNTDLIDQFQAIRDCGNQLLVFVNTLKIEDDQVEFDFAAINQSITLQLKAPTQTVLAYCQQLLKTTKTELKPDLNKIYTAAENFWELIEKLPNIWEQQLLLTENTPNFNLSDQELLQQLEDFAQNSLRLENAPSRNSCGKILVVDDNETNRDLLSRQIEAQGYEVATATNGQQVLEMIQTGEYDLVLLDIIMPEMNGYQVLKSLRDSQWRHTPVIMISALDQIDSVVKCIEMGAEDYLSKPFNPVLLRARIGACLEKKRLRDQEARYLEQLAQANQQIMNLNERLQAENIRLSTELDITRRLQQMILPKECELNQIDELEIAGFMEPAEEVGGDYYDILPSKNSVKIGIGDVTGHGLESGVLTIMVQTAVRTLMESEQTDPTKFLEILNRTIYKNLQRINSDKNLTFCLLDYQEGKLKLSGQHEEILIVRQGGIVERIDTIDLGFPIGLEETITDFICSTQITLNSGDVVVLYTDGVTEAENNLGQQYSLEKLCHVVKQNWQKSAEEIKQIIIEDLRSYIGSQKVYDDITLVVLKKI